MCVACISLNNFFISTESIWNHIGSPLIQKVAKKTIIYGFTFGAKMNELPLLASRRIKKELGYKFSVNKDMVKDCFEGILNPLIALREKWMNQYTIEKIKTGKAGKIIHTNALGLKFNLKKECEDYIKETTKGKLENLKIAARLLAHLAQGQEQLIIQGLIGEQIEENILTYSYDGLSLEVNPDKIEEVKKRLNKWINEEFPESILEYEVY